MNLRNIGLAYKAANYLYGRYRDTNDEQQRDVYDALRALARPENADADKDGKPFDKARLQAGELTRSAHDRLDARREQFRQAQLDKEAKKAAEKREKKAKKKGGAGRAVGVLGLLAAIAGAVWYFVFRDDSPAGQKPAPRKPASTTSVKVTTSKTGGSTIVTGAAQTHGPLSEDPAERDEELLSSIDEQLSTLDTLADEQREGTEPRHQ